VSATDASGGRAQLDPGIAPGGYRLPGATRVGAVRLLVGDLDRSLDWYTRVLGFDVLEQAERRTARGHEGVEGRWAALGPPTDPALVELYERPGARPVARRSRLGLFHFAVLLPERAALGRFVRHVDGAREPVGASDHRVSEALYLYDPDGLGVEVYADRPRDSWRTRGREIEMTTEPLDLPDLVAAAGDEPWGGIPVGTSIGHVHLHVGGLDEAERFYHGGLGLDKMVWSYPGALFLAAGGYHHHLGLNTWAAGATPPSDDDARLLEWELVVPTETDVVSALEAVGADRAAGGLARDPWGTAVRVRASE
jgi:catechol 2,3-dioxygenase